MKNLIVFLFISISTFSVAQNTDSLELVVSSLKGEEKVKTLSDLCYYLSFSNVEKSEKYGNECLALAAELNDSALIANAYNDLSILFTLKSDYKTGLDYNLKAYEIRKNLNEPEKLISSLSKIGVCYSELTEFEMASKYIIEAIKIVEEHGLEKKYFLVYDNLGGLYKEMEDLNDALIYYTKAHKYALEARDQKSITLTLVNIAGIYHKRGELDKSLELHLKAEEGLNEKIDYKTVGLIYSNLSAIYSRREEFKKSLEYAEKAIPYYEVMKNYDGLSMVYNNIASSYMENYEVNKSNQPKVLDYLEKARLYADSSGSLIRLFQNSFSFSTYHLFVRDYPTSRKYKLQADSLQQVIYQNENNLMVEDLTTKYQTEKKEKEIAKQKVEIAEQELKVKKRNYSLIGFALLVIFLVVLGFIIYKQQKFKQQKLIEENRLKDQIAQVKIQNELHEERLRISRDLHDNIGSQLTFIISSVDNMKYLFKAADEKLNNKLTDVSSFTRTTITQLRDTIWALNKDEISFEDLKSRLFNYIENAQLAHDQTKFIFKDELTSEFLLNSVQGVNIYRIVQEAINNAMKYAAATHVSLIISEKNENIFLSIKDDGVGFNMPEIQLGNGLENMKNRANEISAEFAIVSESKKGTEIKLSLNKNKLNRI